MDESMRKGRAFTPPEGATVLMGDPLPGITAQGFASELGEDLSDNDLAAAIALVWSKAGHLMYLVEEDDSRGPEFDAWYELQIQLCQRAIEILTGEGTRSDTSHGLCGAIAPFMVRNGYRDACGWWVHDEGGADEGEGARGT